MAFSVLVFLAVEVEKLYAPKYLLPWVHSLGLCLPTAVQVFGKEQGQEEGPGAARPPAPTSLSAVRVEAAQTSCPAGPGPEVPPAPPAALSPAILTGSA